MARSKAAKEAAEKERKAIRTQLKVKKEEEQGVQQETSANHDIGLPEERKKDASKQKLAAAFKKRGWTALDDDGVIIGVLPAGTDMDTAYAEAKEDAESINYKESYGVRQAGYRSSSKKEEKAVSEIENEDEDEEEAEED